MLPTTYQEFIYKRTYSRWIPEENRREEWEETVDRYAEFFYNKLPDTIPIEQLVKFDEAIRAIRDLKVMPSMRALWTAGPALDVDNICGYNCAYTVIDSLRSFAEILYILMNGAGVGISVERQVIAELPTVPNHIVAKPAQGRTTSETMLMQWQGYREPSDHEPIVFEDSKQGWAEGFLTFLESLFQGVYRPVDLSKIRPKGSRLKTFGGRASGPEPLQSLLDFTARTVSRAAGRKLNSEECSDICCKIAEVVIVGGVRRSAILLLTNPSDRRMQHYKDGEFWYTNPQRRFANISSCYTEKPDPTTFLEDFLALMKSGSGERAFVNRESLQNSRGELGDFGLNPCGEVILKPRQFCNLTEVVVRPEDTLETLLQKAEYATILGTLQATLSNFKFLSKEWKENTEEDRLLGVSLTGVLDHRCLWYSTGWLDKLSFQVWKTNHVWSKLLDINPAKSTTCVKPSGTVSQLVNASSGIHSRYSKHFIRRVRVATTDPLCKLLIAQGVPWKPELGELRETCATAVFEFPLKAPGTSVTKDKLSALYQLGIWEKLKTFYTTHNPSVTVYVKEEEWVEVAAWVYKNWNIVGGITFLPFDGGVYPLAPYEEISAEKFTELSNSFPAIDFSKLSEFEYEDCTEGSREFACSGGACEL